MPPRRSSRPSAGTNFFRIIREDIAGPAPERNLPVSDQPPRLVRKQTVETPPRRSAVPTLTDEDAVRASFGLTPMPKATRSDFDHLVVRFLRGEQ